MASGHAAAYLPHNDSERNENLVNQLSMKLTGAVALFAVLLGVGAFASAARAEDVPTSGNVNNSNGGGAHIANIADLKSPLDASDYDDDPGGEPGSEWFHVAPNLGDEPLQMVDKYVVVYNPADVAELQVTLRTRPGGTVVWETLLPGEDGVSGSECNAMLAIGEGGTVGSGLLATGQKSTEELTEIRNRCTQRTAGVWHAAFPVSKHLPPGWYDQCVAISHLGGGSTPRECVPIRIVPITGYATDVEGLDFGTLKQNIRSVDEGNFALGDDMGTVMGTGNTSPVLSLAYSWMKNDTFDPGTSKYIKNDFDAQINRRDGSGLIVDFDEADGLLGGADPDSTDPFDGADIASLSGICLEPNEPLKLDFSVTPRQVLYDGAYRGLVRLSVGEAEEGCEPSLGSGENAGGDSDGVFNNLPGEPVEQDYSGGEPEPTVTPEPTAEPTEEPTQEPTVEPTEEPTQEPTEEPTVEPTEEPTVAPTEETTP